jgi:chromate reductase
MYMQLYCKYTTLEGGATQMLIKLVEAQAEGMTRNSMDTVVILGIPGSLRSGSLNRGLLRAAQEIAPVGVEIRLADLSQIPLFSGDVEILGDPVSVQEFRQIRTADALLIATPEYNGSIPGVLKNALDWASRLPRQSALVGKFAALIGASPGPSGTAGSQADLRRVLARTHSRVLAEPQVLFANANPLFDDFANLIDDAARQELCVLVDALAAWVRQERTTAASA